MCLFTVVLSTLSAVAQASPLWSSLPSPFTCTGPNGSIVSGNTCLKHTGFDPNTKYWGQTANPKGNCTNYVAYRLGRNGAKRLATSFGNAVGWRGVVQQKLGGKAVNNTPRVGSIAWWDANATRYIGSAGHVAYVEKVADDGKTIYLSESHFDWGSRRQIVHRGSEYWPTKFLHIKDKPKAKAPPTSTPPTSPGPSSPPEPPPSSAGGDKTAPSTPGSLASTHTSTSITLSWSKASDNVGVAGYSLYRGGTKVAKVSSTSYKFTGLSCGTSYKVGVEAYDAAGNRSATASTSTSTTACPKTVQVSKGSSVNVSGCSSSACAFVSVKLSNFGGGSHSVTCYADYPPPTGSYYKYTTSSSTSNVCVYGFLGTHVWVKVDGIESNHLTW